MAKFFVWMSAICCFICTALLSVFLLYHATHAEMEFVPSILFLCMEGILLYLCRLSVYEIIEVHHKNKGGE